MEKLQQLKEEDNISITDPKTQPKPHKITKQKKSPKTSSRKMITFKSSLPANIDLTNERVEQSIARKY